MDKFVMIQLIVCTQHYFHQDLFFMLKFNDCVCILDSWYNMMCIVLEFMKKYYELLVLY